MLKVKEFAEELSSLSTCYQIVPSLDGDPRKVIWKNPLNKHSTYDVELADALAYNLTILDFENFNEFIDFVDKYYSKCRYATWIEMWKDYLYYKNLDSEE